ncbi:phosphatidate cytidylyltransferase [Candidatus Pelagibacter sp.]|uniref:phosphatidate cytidylyltransferase n=1 Tax=Candidatus Pelagibacter sp. TaxID=2024849 RepID=UPI003F83900B
MEKNKYIKTYGIIFLFFSFYTFYVVSENKWNILFIISICISTDIGGYVFGKIFKGPKLTKISPNKTYAGMIGGYVLSLIFLTLIFNYIADSKTTQIQFYIMIIIISTVSQVGDIIVSFFKRKSKIKNTGMIIPGHGGLLDRIDGMIFAFPSYYLIKLNDYIII